MAIIIEAAHEAFGALPCDARRIEAAGHRVEEGACLVGQERVDLRCVGDEFLVPAILAVEDAQRVLLQPLLRFLAELILHGAEMLDERIPPGRARVGIAERVQMQRDALDPEFLQQLVRHRE